MKFRTTLAFNSALLYLSAFLCTTIFHESGHAITGFISGSEPILHHNFVEHLAIDTLPIRTRVTIALAGPVFSLIQGLIGAFAFAKTKRRGLLNLFVLWLSTLGFTNFFGYLMTGPIFKKGDIGKVYSLTDTPFIIQVVIAVIGAGILIFIAYKLTRPFLSFCSNSEWLSTPGGRSRFSFTILILPWVFGSIVMTILYLPVIAVVSIIYPFFSGMIFIFPWQNAKSVEKIIPAPISLPQRLSAPALLFAVILMVIFKVVLAPGIRL